MSETRSELRPEGTEGEPSLLRIDFAAALAKLAPAQMQGRWQLPAELVRLAIAYGAQRAELRLGPRRIELWAPGGRLLPGSIRDLAKVLDEKAPPAERHQALVDLERRDALALAALATFLTGDLQLRSGDGEYGVSLERSGGTLRLFAGGGDAFEMCADGVDVEAPAAVRWLERKGRFSPIPIKVQGREVRRGFLSPLIYKSSHGPPPRSLAIADWGDLPRLYLLRHGIVSTRATVPGFPAFEAAVELAQVSEPGSSGAALRERVNPYLEGLIDDAVALMVRLAHHSERASASVRERIAKLLLEAARRGRLVEEIHRAPLFFTFGEDGKLRRLSIQDLRAAIRFDAAGRGHLEAVSPDQDPRELALGGRRVLVAGAAERALLAEQLGVAFTAPPLRPRPRRSPVRFLEEAVARLAFAWYGVTGRLLPERSLGTAERRFLAAVAKGPGYKVAFRRGDGSVRLCDDRRLLLPRDAPTVRAAVRACERGPEWLYPSLLALTGRRELPPAELRRTWLAGPAQLLKSASNADFADRGDSGSLANSLAALGS